MNSSMIRRSALPVLAALALAACGDDDPTGPGAQSLTVAGTVENRSGAPIPAGARVLIAWAVDTQAGDGAFVFGEGTLDAQAMTFTIALSAPPPAAALLSNTLGVGIIFVTTNQDIAQGDDISDIAESDVIGAAPQHAVIFLRSGDLARSGWRRHFNLGYSVGVGLDNPTGFDEFRPAPSNSVELIIDDLENLDFVNWS